MIRIRPAKPSDIMGIQEIERSYYEGFSCPDSIMESWISTGRFLLTEESGKILGFMFFEYVNKAEALPFIHKPLGNSRGKYCYISEVGTSGRPGVLEGLMESVIRKSKGNGCNVVIWLTGSKSRHDRIESDFLLKESFMKISNVRHWEAYPGHFVHDHHIWMKKIS
ncbi:MAG: hypothetical protein NTY20_01560 [Candidatus Aenigmarchaeota archaeon]|nr:hypothetical protein [Candidatus Aenigmarchaeota archaeon]